MTVHAARLAGVQAGAVSVAGDASTEAVEEVCLLPLQAAAKLRQSTPKSRLFTFDLPHPIRFFILKRLRSEWQMLSSAGIAVRANMPCRERSVLIQ